AEEAVGREHEVALEVVDPDLGGHLREDERGGWCRLVRRRRRAGGSGRLGPDPGSRHRAGLGPGAVAVQPGREHHAHQRQAHQAGTGAEAGRDRWRPRRLLAPLAHGAGSKLPMSWWSPPGSSTKRPRTGPGARVRTMCPPANVSTATVP